MYPVRYLPTGHIYIDPIDDCNGVVDTMLETDYSEEFCLARDFDLDFMDRLMEAGFLLMSMEIKDEEEEGEKEQEKEPEPEPEDRFFLLLPKLHLVRSALFFPELHIKKSVRPFLSHYELRVNTCFDLILDKCVKTHGEAWLTPPLVDALKKMHSGDTLARPVSFEVYREGKLKAGEVGVILGRVYTSYSGYHEENNAGTVQMILMTQWLEKNGFAFLDFGMPLDYKTSLGARNISPSHFVEIFRAAREA